MARNEGTNMKHINENTRIENIQHAYFNKKPVTIFKVYKQNSEHSNAYYYDGTCTIYGHFKRESTLIKKMNDSINYF